MKVLVILNSRSGAQSSHHGESATQEIAKAFEAINVDAQVECTEVPDLTAFTKQAMISDFDAVVAAGGTAQ